LTAHCDVGAATMGQAKLEPDAQAAVLDAATRVYSIAGCRDFARVDLRLEPARV
jgi:D-alanine-D-alanine ligase-like ATP-grasp enzyme